MSAAAARSAGAAWQRLTLSDRAASAGASRGLSGDVDIADFASRVVQGAAERRVCRSGLIAANLQLICLKRSSPCSPRRGRRGGPRRPTDVHKGKKDLGGKPVLFNFVSPRTSSRGRGAVEWSVSSFSTKRPRELLRTVSTLRITRTLKKQKHSRGH